MDLLDVFCTISIKDEYSSGIDSASKSVSSFADKLKSGLATAAKIGTAALGAASTAVGFLVKNSIEGYGEYEQLVGGVETLFKQSSDTVMGYAENAYKTAGLSANEYMETVTSFSASLLQSLGGDTQAAADYADMAITDMSDNANKMGTAMESIQNAYQGFAKQNFTMLDNLKLGYGGTKEEMERLLEDASKLSGIEYDISSYADIVDAIHAVQTEMGITGTTALEASTTIQGSVSAAKSAWENLLTGLGDENANLEGLIGSLVSSAETAAGNIIPRITQILSGMGSALQAIAPVLAAEIPALISSTLPSLFDAGAQLLAGLITGIVGALPELVAAAPTIIGGFVTAFSGNSSMLLGAGGQLVDMISSGVMNGVPKLAEAAVSIMGNLGQYLQVNLPLLLESGLEALVQLSGSIRENAGLLVDGAISLAESLAHGLADSIPTIIENVPTIVSNIANTINDNAPKVFEAAVGIIGTLIKGLIDSIPTIVANIPKIVAAIWDTITAVNWIDLGGNIIKGLAGGISGMVNFAKEAISNIAAALKGGVKELPKAFLDIGKNIIQGLINGIKSMASSLVKNIGNVVTSAVSGVKNLLGIHSPSTVFAKIGGFMAEGLGEGWEDEYKGIKRRIEDGLDFGTATVNFASTDIGKTSGALRSAFSDLTASMSQNATIIVQSVLDGKIIGETAYQYSQNRQRAYGV